MRCDWEFTGEVNERGWRKVRCLRNGCGTIGGWTPHPLEKIDSDCQGWPRAREWGHWLAFALEVLGLSKTRWTWIAGRMNLIEPNAGCGCDAREKWLNSFGGKVVLRWRRTTECLSALGRLGRH